MQATNKKSILFICTENAARSQMAEALLRHKAGDWFNVYSAGTQPKEVDLRAINALDRFGINSQSLTSKNINLFEGEIFDYVITLCNKANDECRTYSYQGKQLAWDIGDPKKNSDSNAFSITLHELNKRLSMFLQVEQITRRQVSNSKAETVTEENNHNTDLDPITFFKSLTDTIRLTTLMLTYYHGELCVCELMEAMAENSQPKVSRNLSVLKKANIIIDRKNGQWVFYRINPNLPMWAKSVIAQTTENNITRVKKELLRLDKMQNRPNKTSFC